jgi:hypothetical protein
VTDLHAPRKQTKQKARGATIDERVAMLEEHRAGVVRQRQEVEGKLAEIRARIAAAEGEGGDGAGSGGR